MLKMSLIQIDGNKTYTALMKNAFFVERYLFHTTAYVVFVFILSYFIKLVDVMFVCFYITSYKRNK